MNTEYYRHRRPSLFFPIALITAGVVWLLVNSGTIAVENVYRLAPYWPVLLILAGLGLLLERLWWPLSALMWLAAAAALVWFLVFPPAFLPAAPTSEQQLDRYTEPLEEANSALVNLDLSVHPTRIFALEDSEDLIDAEINHFGIIRFSTTGEQKKTVYLSQQNEGLWWNFGWELLSRPASIQPWEIGLSPRIPLDLVVDAATARTEVDLSELQLHSLDLDGGTGNMEIDLPEDGDRFDINLDMSTGNVTLRVPKTSSFDLEVDGSTGNLIVDIADGVGVEVEVKDGGVGSLRLGSGFTKVREGDDDDEGVWQNAAYATTSTPVRITLDISTGNIELR